MEYLKLCQDKDVILPLSTGPEKDYLIVQLVRSYGINNSKEKIVYLGQNYYSTKVFLNLMKLHIRFVPKEISHPSDITGDEHIVCILPDSKNILEIGHLLKDSVKLLILNDLHKIYDNPNSNAVKLLNMIRESSPNSRFVGFTIPLQTSNFTISEEYYSKIGTTMVTTFGVLIDTVIEGNLKHKYFKLDSLKIRQFHEYENRFQELIEISGFCIDWDRFIYSNQRILDIQKQLIDEFTEDDWSHLNLVNKKKLRGVPFLEPFKALDIFYNVLRIYIDFGEICALKAIELYENELYPFMESLVLNHFRKYKEFLMKILSSLRSFRNCILFYLPKDIVHKLISNESLSFHNYLGLSTSRLNRFVDELFEELNRHNHGSFKIIVHTESSTSAKILSFWMNDFSMIISNNTSKDMKFSSSSFYYLSNDNEKSIKSKFIEDLYFYRNRECMLKQFCQTSDKNCAILFTNSFSLSDKNISCDLLISLNTATKTLNFIRLKRFLKPNSHFTVLSGDKYSESDYLKLWEVILYDEAYYFNEEVYTKIVYHPVVKSLPKILIDFKEIIFKESESNILKNDEKITFSNVLYRTVEKVYPKFNGNHPKPKENFECRFVYELCLDNNDIQFGGEKKRRLVLIVPENLPKLCEFDIINQYHSYRVSFKKINIRIDLSAHDVQTLFKFNRFIYKNILNIDCEYDLNGESSSKILVAPLNKSEDNFDWNLMIDSMEQVYYETASGKPFCAEMYEDTIVCSEVKANLFFYVSEIDFKQNPRSELPSKAFPTYAHYYKRNFDRSVSDDRQPLLKVFPINCDLNFNRRRREKPLFIIPEFYKILILPFSLWLKITSLPIVFYNLYAQVNILTFNQKILDSLSNPLRIDPQADHLPLAPHYNTADEEIQDLQDIFDNWYFATNFDQKIDYLDMNFPENSNDKDKISHNEDNRSQSFDDYDVENEYYDHSYSEIQEIVKNNFLYEEAFYDKTYKGYKEMAGIIDFLKLDLLYDQAYFENIIYASHECKIENSLLQNNLINSYDEILHKISLDENNDLYEIVKKITHDYYHDDDENADKCRRFTDLSESENWRIDEQTIDINQVLKSTLNYIDSYEDSLNNQDDTYRGRSAREFYAEVNYKKFAKNSKKSYENFNKTFSQTVSCQPKFKDLIYISTLAFVTDFNHFTNFALLGRSFIRYILSSAILYSYKDKKSQDMLAKIMDECYFEKICVDVALKSGLGQLIGFEFNAEHWCPPFFKRKCQLERNGVIIDPAYEQFITNEILAQSVQAYVGLYFKESGPKITIEIMSKLGFDMIQTIDIKNFKTYQWNNCSFPVQHFEFSDSKKAIKICSDFNTLELQCLFDYRFKNTNLLLHSIIDPSFGEQKQIILSIIGKTVLDFILTNCSFKLNPDSLLLKDYYLLSPHAYSQFALEIGLDKYVAFNSTNIFRNINFFLREFHNSDHKMQTEYYFHEQEIDNKFYTEIPSILINSFQAIFGAIYIDSGFNLQTVYKAFSPFLSQKIDYYKTDEHNNPTQRMDDLYNHIVSIKEPILDENGFFIVQHDIYRGGRVDGRSNNLSLAREIGAKKILRFMIHRSDSQNENE